MTSRRGRPTRQEGAALDDRLRRVALEAFLAGGFDGTTMEAVAAGAGVSKRTLYTKYADKRALFASVVPWALSRMATEDLIFEPGDDDLETALGRLAREVLARVVDPDAVRLRRLALLEAHRFPEFAAAANVELWRQNVRPVVELLSAHAAAGSVVVEDVETVADLFLTMVAGAATILADFGVRPSRRDAKRHVDVVVRVFLDGIRPRA